MKRLGIMLSAILMASSAAQAADLNWNSGTSTLYTPTPVSGWSGFYAGINGGFGWGTSTSQPIGGGARTDHNTNGGTVGATAGYNMDMGGFVLGGEADLQWANIGYSEDVGASTFKSSIDFFGTIRGRAGASFGQVMPYVTGGAAIGRGTSSETLAGVTRSQSSTHVGWTVGLGLEAQATQNISLKAEYLYVDMGTQPYGGIRGMDEGHRFSVIRAGINYKF